MGIVLRPSQRVSSPVQHIFCVVWMMSFILQVTAGNQCKATVIKADCSHLSLETIPNDLSPRTRELDLSFNNLTQLHAKSFARYKDLKVLNLKNNSITSRTLDLEAFTGLDNLETLIFSNNKINSIQIKGADGKLHNMAGDCLKPLTSLRRVDYSGNQLHVLHHRTFTNADVNTDLEDLDLSNNELRAIATDAIFAMGSLKRLNLSHNSLHVLFEFEATQGLQVLDLSHNHLTKLKPEVFVELEQLENISLAYNRFEQVPADALSVLRKWDFLDLSGNPIAVLNASSFAQTDGMRLDVLRINNMPQLRRIDSNALSKNTDLTSLEVRDNPVLSYIDVEALALLDTLFSLDLRNNALTSLERFTDFNWREVRELKLQGNPWHCDCKLQWLKKLVKEKNLETDFRCASPSPVSGRMFSTLTSLPCFYGSASGYSTVSYVLPVAAAVLVLTIALVFFLVRRRGLRSAASVHYMSLDNDQHKLISAEKEVL